MSFLKNILGAFVEFKQEEKQEGSKDVAQPKTENKKAAATDSIPAAPSPSYTHSSSTSSAIPHTLAEYQKHFEHLIEEANAKNPAFQGTDFKEFIDSKTDVEAITDEGTKYRTAFNVLKRTGLTKEKLITTGKEYINVVSRDMKGFENAYLQQYKAEVEQKEQLLQKKAGELQALSEKISALNQEMIQISQEIVNSKDHLNSNRNSFMLAGENKKKEIETELQKIDLYFNEP